MNPNIFQIVSIKYKKGVRRGRFVYLDANLPISTYFSVCDSSNSSVLYWRLLKTTKILFLFCIAFL